MEDQVKKKRKLRVLNIIVQPVLVWDDGEEFTSGPEVNQVSLKMSELVGFENLLNNEIARIQAELEEKDNG